MSGYWLILTNNYKLTLHLQFQMLLRLQLNTVQKYGSEGEIVDLGAELNVIKKSGSWYSYNDSKLAQGRDATKAVIKDNPELADELEKLIFEALKEKK